MTALLGLDGGGSSSRVQMQGGGTLGAVTRTGGPLNVSTLSPAAWRGTLDDLLEGLPEPSVAVACIAGVRSPATRAAVMEHLHVRFPRARVRAEPDFVAALECFDHPVTACVVAGTGSIVCSREDGGALVTSGGEGPRVGDRGSAFRLGERELTRRGATMRGHESPAEIAALAPRLTRAADAGDADAWRAVADEMGLLAEVTASHLRAHAPRCERLRIGLVGSVWNSAAARTSYATALERAHPGVSCSPGVRTPVEAALVLARRTAR